MVANFVAAEVAVACADAGDLCITLTCKKWQVDDKAVNRHDVSFMPSLTDAKAGARG